VFWVFVAIGFLFYGDGFLPQFAWGQTESGLIEKSLRQSRPEFQPPFETQTPEIIIQDSRQLGDAGAGPSFFVRKIEIEGNILFSEQVLSPLVDVGEGLEATLGVLTLMANEVTAFYAEQGYFLARAYIPGQEIVDGVVRMKVVEGKVNRVEVQGNDWTRSSDYQEYLGPVQEESALKEQTLESTLLELNDMLGVQVRSVLKPGELPGTSDLVLEVTEGRPYNASFDYDNFGSRFTGQHRMGFTLTTGNLVRLGDQFYFRFVRSDLAQIFLQPSYLFPLNYSGLKFKASYTFSEHELGDNLVSLRAGGKSHILTLELSQVLGRKRFSQFSLRAGINFKTFENEQLGNNTSKDSPQDLYVGLGGNFADTYRGRNFIDFQVKTGIHESDDSRGLISRTRGQGNVIVTNANFTRFQSAEFLNSYFIMKASTQMADARVLSPDLFAVGGMGSVRGFPLSEYSGDEGYVLSLEYVIPFPWKLKFMEKSDLTLDRVVSVSGFIDSGKVFVIEAEPGERDQGITGAGASIKLNLPSQDPMDPSISFAMTYGIPVMGNPLPTDRTFGTLYLAFLMGYF